MIAKSSKITSSNSRRFVEAKAFLSSLSLPGAENLSDENIYREFLLNSALTVLTENIRTLQNRLTSMNYQLSRMAHFSFAKGDTKIITDQIAQIEEEAKWVFNLRREILEIQQQGISFTILDEAKLPIKEREEEKDA